MATVMGITIETIYGLWFLCADLVYVILFPQLVSVVYLAGTNTYGSLFGYCSGLIFRLLGGEPLIDLPAVVHFPWYDDVNQIQRFPYKTLAMLVSFAGIVGVSYPMKYLFENGTLPRHWDVFHCVVDIPDEVVALTGGRNEVIEANEMTKIAADVGAMHNGQINPALKFSKEDLLTSDGGDATYGSMTPPPHEYGNADR